jgi:aflatoxin B1 aldehyde reductase
MVSSLWRSGKPANCQTFARSLGRHGVSRPLLWQDGPLRGLCSTSQTRDTADTPPRALGAGTLTAKLANNDVTDTRFDERNPLSKAFARIFGADDLKKAIQKFDVSVRALGGGLTPLEVAVRWIFHHSVLGDEDAVIIGASRTSQLEETVALVRNGPLPPNLVTLGEELWERVKGSRKDII